MGASEYLDLDLMERDLGLDAVEHVLETYGGTVRSLPQLRNLSGSQIERDLGHVIADWILAHHDRMVAIPSSRGRLAERLAAQLRADVIDAMDAENGMSANELATKHGVTRRRVLQIRAEIRADRGSEKEELPLFKRL